MHTEDTVCVSHGSRYMYKEVSTINFLKIILINYTSQILKKYMTVVHNRIKYHSQRVISKKFNLLFN